MLDVFFPVFPVLHAEIQLKELPEDVDYIRPFLSSTFRDFNEERDILVKTSVSLLLCLFVFGCPLLCHVSLSRFTFIVL